MCMCTNPPNLLPNICVDFMLFSPEEISGRTSKPLIMFLTSRQLVYGSIVESPMANKKELGSKANGTSGTGSPATLLPPKSEASVPNLSPAGDIAVGPASLRDTFVVLFTLSAVCVTVYFSYQLWKKHRRRKCNFSKLEDYRYSRLSQNEVDVDSLPLSNPANDYLEPHDLLDDQDPRLNGETPATLHVQMENSQTTRTSTSIMDEMSDEDLLQ